MMNGHKWIPQVKEMIAFLVGSGMVLHETIYANHAETIIVVTGAALMGVLGAGTTQRLLRKFLEE